MSKWTCVAIYNVMLELHEVRFYVLTMNWYSMITRLIVGIGLLCVAASLPFNNRRWFYDNDREGECVPINHPCNQIFNRSEAENYAKFPNTRGMTLDSSMEEFRHFSVLLISQRPSCYLPLWSLLCFHYFPQCHPTLPLKYVVTPCRETCERAKRGCTDFFDTPNTNISWPEHLECAKFNSSIDDNLCINNSADPNLVSRVDLMATTTPASSPTPNEMTSTEPSASPETTTTPPTTSPPTTSPATTTPPTTSPPTTSPPTTTSTPMSSEECPSRCNHRTRATGGTFKNNDYTFAANVTIISSGVTDVHHTFLAHVSRSWTFDSRNCSRFENHDLILIRTSYSHCSRCPDFNTTAGSNFYLIAGYCNNRGWYLPPNDSLVSPWHSNPKYPARLENWIQNGINARTQN